MDKKSRKIPRKHQRPKAFSALPPTPRLRRPRRRILASSSAALLGVSLYLGAAQSSLGATFDAAGGTLTIGPVDKTGIDLILTDSNNSAPVTGGLRLTF